MQHFVRFMLAFLLIQLSLIDSWKIPRHFQTDKMFFKNSLNDIDHSKSLTHKLLVPMIAIMSSVTLCSPFNVYAKDVQYKLPPIDRKDTKRCEFISSNMGQANAARDKLYDLRECDMSGKSAAGMDLSGVIASDGTFVNVDFKEAQLSKAYARNSKFQNSDFTNGIVDRVSFDNSDLSGSIFKNSVLSGTTYENANLENTDFTDAYLGPFDLRNLCSNPTLRGTNPITNTDSRSSAGCPE